MRRTLTSTVCLAFLVFALTPLQGIVNTTTIGFALLLGVLFSAVHMGSRPALAASVVAMLGYNFFFLPPILRLTIADPQNWVALAAFSVTALVAGQLSANAKERAVEALLAKQQTDRLYTELQAAFEKASQAEAIKRSDLMKTALLDAVTHDLRTPLTSIRAAATTLRKAQRMGETLTPEVNSELIELVDEESLHLDQIISSFVELARIEAGDLMLKTTWGSLNDVAQAAIKRAQTLLLKHRVLVNIPETLPLMHIDVRALAEVIYTLLDNARKYSPDNSEISISARRIERDVEVSVSDHGSGIQKDDLSKVFDKFYRGADRSNSRLNSPGGLGVGLSIAKGLVEAHSGSIWIAETIASKGTTITFRIPIREDGES
ncbi:MAG TPA: ATP-binding protein [Edaphobacter sp.]|nr:ATP-binding protein [Edaphobacter sp.]